MDSLSLIRQQIRLVVDPMLLRLMNRLYDSPNATHLRDSVIPPPAVIRIAEQYFQTESPLADVSLALGESIALGDCVYIGSDQKVYRVLASQPSHAGKCVGLLKAINNAQGVICLFGRISLPSVWTSLTAGHPVYVSETGAIQQTIPSTGFIQQVGIALSASAVFVSPFYTPILRS